MSHSDPMRRGLLLAAVGTLAGPLALAQERRVLAPMTEGPFYPPERWRAREADWDADLTQVTRGGSTSVARGEHLSLRLQVVDRRGTPIDRAEVEIWQCDVQGAYRHPRVAAEPGSFDPGYQGFGAARSAADGTLGFRTIRPVPYPGRTPHIHVRLRHAAFGEITSQLFVAGDPGNAADSLWRRLDTADRSAQALLLTPANDAGLRWSAQQVLVVPAG